MRVGCILNKRCEPFAPLSLIPGGKVHKAGDGWIRQESVERIPIAQNKVSQDQPLSFKDRHLLSCLLLVCCAIRRHPVLLPLYARSSVFFKGFREEIGRRASSLFEANRLRKTFGDTEQFDRDLTCRGRTSITSQPLCPRKPIMGPLHAGKGNRLSGEAGRGGRGNLDFDTLMTHQLDARTSVVPTAPVTPEQGCRTDDERMQQH